MQAVIISFDSLAANALGCYGNEWIETPHWDAFAATGAVFDRHFADTLGPRAGMAWVHGSHPFAGSVAPPTVSLVPRLKSQGVSTRMVTVNQLQAWQQTAQFDDSVVVQVTDSDALKPDTVPFAKLVRAGLTAWNDTDADRRARLLWLHAPCPGRPPEGFDSLYFEDFEERGQQLDTLTDEQRAAHPAVYAGAVSLLDHWLGEFLNSIQATTEPTLVIITALAGHIWKQPLQPESTETGDAVRRSGDQLVRTPLLLKLWNDPRSAELTAIRSSRLVQTCDLLPTLLDWFQIPTDASTTLSGQSWLKELTDIVPARTHLTIDGGEPFAAVRTADWLMVRERRHSDDLPTTPWGADHVCLFVKPDDVWDVNDVASQQPDVIGDLIKRLPADR